MNIGFYSGVTGMVAFQQNMDSLAHNIANVNTTGYKATRSAFDDLLYTRMDTNEVKPLVGHGVKISNEELLYQQAAPRTTNNPLDFAIIGDGFFAVEREGEIQYTRDGTFDIGLQGSKTGYLVTSDGGFVLDTKGKRIKLNRAADSNVNFDTDELPRRLGVYTFPNPYALQRTDASSFIETEESGAAKSVSDGKAKKTNELPFKLVQGALESSGVDLADSMVQVIIAQKGFQFNSKMVQTADEIEEIVNNLR